MAYASRLYPRAKPRGFTLQWIKVYYNQVYLINKASLREHTSLVEDAFLINLKK